MTSQWPRRWLFPEIPSERGAVFPAGAPASVMASSKNNREPSLGRKRGRSGPAEDYITRPVWGLSFRAQGRSHTDTYTWDRPCWRQTERPASLKSHPGGWEGRTSREVGHAAWGQHLPDPGPAVTRGTNYDTSAWCFPVQGTLSHSWWALEATETQAAVRVIHKLAVHAHGGPRGWSPQLVLLPPRRHEAAAAMCPRSTGVSSVAWHRRTHGLAHGAAHRKSGCGVFCFFK